MKGYHYTSLKNYQGIKVQGLLPSPIVNVNILGASSETEGSWLFQNPQEEVALFGMLIDRFVKNNLLWKIVELEIDFSITDCLQALHEEDTFLLKHEGSCGNWIYHKDEPIIIVSQIIPACQITLRRSFDLRNAIKEKR